MATIKSYTNIEQSKKLAEILPLESADMLFQLGEDKYADSIKVPLTKKHWEQMMPDINPCWSLAALLDILKDKITFGGASDKEWFVSYTIKNPTKVLFIYKSNLVDACVAMIEKLNELNML